MILKLAMLEGLSFFAAVCGATVVSTTVPLVSWTDVALLAAKALTISLCYAVSFYYSDLYDLRIVRTLREFAGRLFQAFGVAFILLAILYVLFPAVTISGDRFLISLIVIITMVLPLRAVFYGIMGQKPFLERVLIFGTTPLASTIIKEMRSRPYSGSALLGVVDNAPAP